MARRPLAPDVWEQALVNGRRIHPGDDAAALSWSEAWYQSQGGRFDGDAEPAVAADPEPVAEPEPAPEPAAEPVAEPPKAAAKPKRRARVEGGQFKGDDPATPAVNEAWEGGDAA